MLDKSFIDSTLCLKLIVMANFLVSTTLFCDQRRKFGNLEET